MSRVLHRLAAIAFAVGMLVASLGPAGIVPAPVALGASTDLTVVTTARYTVQPAQRRIRVAVDVSVANHRADTLTNRFYFDHTFLAVQPGAANPTVVGSSGASAHIASRTADATMLRLDFGKLYGGHAISFRFAFDLRDTGTGAQRLVRVGTSLVTFPVWAYASDGTSGSRVIVRFPKGYDVSVQSGQFASQTQASDGSVVLASGALASPLTFFAFVTAQQAATYRASSLSVTVGGAQIPLTLRAWKDDPAWAGRVGGIFKQALPRLRSAIGLPWPHDGAVIVQEAVSRSTGGYAGLYDPTAATIQIAYWASPAVIVHEAAHGWFNSDLLADRWADEGFASLYAQQVFKALKIKAAAPKLTSKLQAAAIPLNAWTASPETSAAIEAYGYAASYSLAGLIAKQAGPAALARVWADAHGGIGAYQPPAAQGSAGPETVDAAPDWRGLLDLLETETGSDFTALWRSWVVRPEEAGLLEQRAAAREAYQAVLATTNGWALPRSIRDALRGWHFDTATALLAQARTALAERSTLEAQAASSGLALPDAVRRLFEAGDFAGAVTEAQHEEAAMTAITAADAGRAAVADDVFTTVGMIGLDPSRDLAAARQALAGDDLVAAVTSAESAQETWASAHDEGRRRVVMGLALVAAVTLLTVSLATRLRRSRRHPTGVIAT